MSFIEQLLYTYILGICTSSLTSIISSLRQRDNFVEEKLLGG